ncbi:hypothetical protein BCR35DRAFT_350415, partial [Leucosporidium creatinivorum]
MSNSSPWILEADVVYSMRLPRTSLLPEQGASDPLDGPLTAYQIDSAPSHPLVQILRVSKSPAGSFDALLFSWPFLPPSTLQQPRTRKFPRVTRLYCSTIASAVLLRKHYHLPAHLASFTFTPLRRSPSSLLIQVSLPAPPSSTSAPPSPFFALIAAPFGRTVSLPPLLPSVSLLQPPLPPGEFESPSSSPSQAHFLRTTTTTLPFNGSQQVKFYPALKINGRLRFGNGVDFVDCELRGEEKCAKGSVAREVEIWAGEGEVLRECSAVEVREGRWKAAKL